MTRGRRRALIRIVERVALGVALLDGAIYFLGVRPLHRDIAELQSSNQQLSRQVLERQKRVDRLETIQKSLPGADGRLQSFLQDHMPSRRRGFSDAAQLVRVLTGQSGVSLDNVSYKLTSEKGEPLDRLGIDMTVEGPFTNLLRFAHALETSNDLILIKTFSFSTGQGSAISLQVGAELFLVPSS